MKLRKNFLIEKFMSFLIVLLGLVGCSSPSTPSPPQKMLSSDSSIIMTDSPNITIEKIDTITLDKIRKRQGSDGKTVLFIKPGIHKIAVNYWIDPSRQSFPSYYLFELNTLPDRQYQLKYQELEELAKVWFEDIASGKSIGNILESRKEPILSSEEILTHSTDYTFQVPKEEGWVVGLRDQEHTALAKLGNGENGTYGIIIYFSEFPTLNSKKEFMEFLKKQRETGMADPQSKILQDTLVYYDTRKVPCARSHAILDVIEKDDSASQGSSRILEIVGFHCRHSLDSNKGINLNYFHRYDVGKQDPQLVEKATKAFELLKF